MGSSHTLDRIDTAFVDDRLVPDAGLILPATLVHHLGLKRLVDDHLDLGTRVGGANAGDKILTLVMSALAGGDHIDHVDALRAGDTGRIRVRPTPGSQLALFVTYDFHAFITDRDGDTLTLVADHRRHAEVENAIRDLKEGVGLDHLLQVASPPTGPGWPWL